ncbi:MAG: sugar transferase [Chitinophagia bacterium]|nr:sugar transferase [Chitinophagia bacterium]
MNLSPHKKIAILKLLLFDYLSAILAWLSFWAYRQNFLFSIPYLKTPEKFFLRDALNGLIIIPVAWCVLYYLSGTYFDLYRKSRLHEINRTIISCFIGCLFVSVFIFSNDKGDNQYFTNAVIHYLFLHLFITLTFRLALLYQVKQNLIKGKVGFNTLIIGGNMQAINIYKQVSENPIALGNIFIGFIYSNKEKGNGMSEYLPQLGHINELEAIIDKNNIEEVIVAVDSSEHHLLENILTRLCYRPVVVKVLPDYYDILSGSVKTSNVYDAVLIHIHPELMPDWQRVCKRMIDIVCSAVALIALSPFLLFVAIMVKLSSPGGILYKQQRIGLLGRPFYIYKFRSMYIDAEAKGPALSSKMDNRITPWGRIMRKWRIDELPQFVNIIKGEMSLVGPRPERKHYIDIIIKDHEHYKYLHKVKPGLTSWGMVKFGYAENVDEMIERMRYDLLYIENCSLALDIKIMLYTLMVIFQGRGK